jgi:hypothetical protein
VTRRLLRGGDKVQIGTTVLTFTEGAPASGAPPAPAPAPAPAAQTGAAAADEEVDLFGSEEAPPAPMPAPARPASPPPAPPHVSPPDSSAPTKLTTAPPLRVEPPKPRAPAPPPPVSRTPPPAEVVEFADEIVEVKKTTRSEPAAAAGPPAAAGVAIDRTQRVLQFHKNAAKGGLLGDDISQMSSGTRAIVFLAVLGGAVLIAWLAMQLAK